MTFDDAFERLIGHEGGYVWHDKDPGGETNWGISKRAYPSINIRELTRDHARMIYLTDYWGPAGCDAVPDGIKADLFDMAVNAGVKTAIRCLQRSAGETADGILGPRTLQAVQSMPAPRLVARFNGQRLQALTDLATWPTFGKGWARRVAANLMEA
jgi:lysozyme family protein